LLIRHSNYSAILSKIHYTLLQTAFSAILLTGTQLTHDSLLQEAQKRKTYNVKIVISKRKYQRDAKRHVINLLNVRCVHLQCESIKAL